MNIEMWLEDWLSDDEIEYGKLNDKDWNKLVEDLEAQWEDYEVEALDNFWNDNQEIVINKIKKLLEDKQ